MMNYFPFFRHPHWLVFYMCSGNIVVVCNTVFNICVEYRQLYLLYHSVLVGVWLAKQSACITTGPVIELILRPG